MLCLSLDSGTITCKGLVLDADTGKVLAQASVPHSFVGGVPRGHVEQVPQIWSDAAERVILACLEKIRGRRSEVVAFGVSAQQYVTLDDRNLPNGTALIHGLNSSNTNRHDIARALIEGIVIGLAQGMNRLISLGIEAKELHITGGGAKSASMSQIVADVFGLPVVGFKVVEGAALGAAVQAGWTYCQTKGEPLQLEKIVKLAVKTDRKTRAEPRKENRALYADLRGRHADLTRKLASSGYL